jgi:hypothetical protein
MAWMRIFQIELRDGFTGEAMTLEGGRSFEGASPFYLSVELTQWAMTIDEARRVATAAGRLSDRIRRAGQKNERPKPGAIFRQKLSTEDQTVAAVIEIGLCAVDRIDAVYFEFAGMRVALDDEQGANLLGALERFAGDIADMKRGSGEVSPFFLKPDWGF